MDRQLQGYIKRLINSTIAIIAAEGIIKGHDSNLLETNGGHIKCTKHGKNFFCIAWAM